MAREVFFISITEAVEGGFVPSLVTEGEPGHAPLTGKPGGRPWVWGPTYAEAKAQAVKANAERGISESEALDVVLSSMRAGAIRPRVSHS